MIFKIRFKLKTLIKLHGTQTVLSKQCFAHNISLKNMGSLK